MAAERYVAKPKDVSERCRPARRLALLLTGFAFGVENEAGEPVPLWVTKVEGDEVFVREIEQATDEGSEEAS